MKVYRIEHQVRRIGPFQVGRGHSADYWKVMGHAYDAIPASREDFPTPPSNWHKYAFLKLCQLRTSFNSKERRMLARMNFILACYNATEIEVGKSGLQVRYNAETAALAWTKKL